MRYKISLTVVPNSKKERIEFKDEEIKVWIPVAPEKGKANEYIIKMFKERGINITILKGFKNRRKIILSDLGIEEIKERFNQN